MARKLASSRTPLLGFALILTVAALVTGCQAPGTPVGPTDLVLDVPDYNQFIDSTIALLRELDLPPRVVDRTAGLIVTQRSTGAQWFEFWRSDVQGGYQQLESSLQTIGRTVTINITTESTDASLTGAQAATMQPQSAPAALPSEGGGRFRLTIRVDKARYSAPERQVTTASGALGLYSERLPTAEGLRGKYSRGAHWIDLGRDGMLESYVAKRIAGASPSATVISMAQPELGPTAPQTEGPAEAPPDDFAPIE